MNTHTKLTIILMLFLSIQINGQKKEGIMLVDKNNQVQIPSNGYIKEIKIKRGLLKKTKQTLLLQAIDSTLHYDGNCLNITYLDKNEATKITKDNTSPDYLRGEIYSLTNHDKTIVIKNTERLEYIQDSIKLDHKNNVKYLQPSGDRLYFKSDTHYSRLDTLIAQNLRVSFGYGPESYLTGILPKISYIQFIDKDKIQPYYGMEISAWIIEAFWMSNNYLYGVKKDFLSFECSIGYLWIPETIEETSQVNHYFHSTITPKLGVKFWKLWFKVGPSFPIYKNYSEDLYGSENRIGNTPLNFELLIFPN